MISFACLGHWYAQLLFGAPSAGVMLVMGRDSIRKRRRRRDGESSPSSQSSS
jgi:hypothetical protein